MKKHTLVRKALLLLLTIFFLFFSNGRWCFALAAWLYPLFLLRYTRKEKPLKVFVVTSIIISICYQFMFLKFTLSNPSSILYYLPAFMGPVYGLLFTFDSIMYHKIKGFLSTLIFPLCYVIIEWLITLANPLGNTGMLAYSQYQILPVMQLASITGTYGITFIIVWFGSIANWFYDNKDHFLNIKKHVIIYTLIMLTIITYGSIRLIIPNHQGTVRISGIHVYDLRGNEGQDMWMASKNNWEQFRESCNNMQDKLFHATEREAKAGSKIIVWSEISPLVAKEDEPNLLKRAENEAKEQDIYLVISPYIIHTDPNEKDENKLYIIDPQGKIVLEHYKYGGNIIEGTVNGSGILKTVDTPHGKLSGVICWDQDFPDVMRQTGQKNIDILLAPTADWREIDPLHSMVGLTRAIENGYSLFRQDINGLSIATDYKGQTLASMDHFTSSNWTITAQVPIKGTFTIYSVLGDWFVYLSIAAFAGIILKRFVLTKNNKPIP